MRTGQLQQRWVYMDAVGPSILTTLRLLLRDLGRSLLASPGC